MNWRTLKCLKASEWDSDLNIGDFYDDMERVGRRIRLGPFSPVLAAAFVLAAVVLSVSTTIMIELCGGRI